MTTIQEASAASSKAEQKLIADAPQFDVHKWSNYPEINAAVNAIFNEIATLRKLRGIRIREADKVKRSIKVIIMDLWAAAKLSTNPYRAVSLNKSNYAKETRYKKIFLKYDYFSRAVQDLKHLKYIVLAPGFYNKADPKKSRVSRIKATPALIDKILNPDYGVNALVASKGKIVLAESNSELKRECIILRDKGEDDDKFNIDYEDTAVTTLMRENLHKLNDKLADTRISLHITGGQYEEMLTNLSSKEKRRRHVDFTKNSMYRVFNNASFEQGGRFYGVWWQSIPREYRKYIDINHKQTVELDYSGHHFRILYAMEGLTPPDDPYDLPDFAREDQKIAALIMINASDLDGAVRAIACEGVRGARSLIKALKVRHSLIEKYFFTGIGNTLMYKDSVLAESVMLRMLGRGAAVLTMHDSFIVRSSYDNELEEIMNEEFERAFGNKAKLKYKKTVGEERLEFQGITDTPFVNFKLDEYLQEIAWERSIWG